MHNPKHDAYHHGIPSVVYKFFVKKSRDTTTHTGTGIVSENQQVANILQKLITIKFRNMKYIHLIEITFGEVILQKRY